MTGDLFVSAAATLSADGRFRYSLTRVWGAPDSPLAVWVMLNPSTADGQQDDPTIRRVMGFSRALGCGRLEVVNLFALRSPSPEVVWAALGDAVTKRAPLAAVAEDVIGPQNDDHLHAAAHRADFLIAAWGNDGRWRDRAGAVYRDLLRFRRPMVQRPGWACLGVTGKGQPRHPLYLRRATKLQHMRRLKAVQFSAHSSHAPMQFQALDAAPTLTLDAP